MLNITKYSKERSQIDLFLFCFNTPEGITTMVDTKDLERARAYLNQFPWDQWLYIPSERYGVNLR